MGAADADTCTLRSWKMSEEDIRPIEETDPELASLLGWWCSGGSNGRTLRITDEGCEVGRVVKKSWLASLLEGDLFRERQDPHVFEIVPNKDTDWDRQGVDQLVNEGSVGRNERCPCGSGKKFKRCCG